MWRYISPGSCGGTHRKNSASQFNIDNDSTVSNMMERMKKRFAEDRKFLQRMEKIVESTKYS
jgi:hypothetical protein